MRSSFQHQKDGLGSLQGKKFTRGEIAEAQQVLEAIKSSGIPTTERDLMKILVTRRRKRGEVSSDERRVLFPTREEAEWHKRFGFIEE